MTCANTGAQDPHGSHNRSVAKEVPEPHLFLTREKQGEQVCGRRLRPGLGLVELLAAGYDEDIIPTRQAVDKPSSVSVNCGASQDWASLISSSVKRHASE